MDSYVSPKDEIWFLRVCVYVVREVNAAARRTSVTQESVRTHESYTPPLVKAKQ
jgi:hypothetical protein